MSTTKLAFLLLNVIGGAAVLGSYAYGLRTHPGQEDLLWGGIPASLRPVYTWSILAATAGWFPMLWQVLWRLNPAAVRLPLGLPFESIHAGFALILVPSALWMGLTFAYLAAPSTGLWLAVRGVLFLVALGSLGMVAVFGGLRWSSPGDFWWPGLIGAAVFAFHTTVLDAIVWPAFFPR